MQRKSIMLIATIVDLLCVLHIVTLDSGWTIYILVENNKRSLQFLCCKSVVKKSLPGRLAAARAEPVALQKYEVTELC